MDMKGTMLEKETMDLVKKKRLKRGVKNLDLALKVQN